MHNLQRCTGSLTNSCSFIAGGDKRKMDMEEGGFISVGANWMDGVL
jgi:hypothetical protein